MLERLRHALAWSMAVRLLIAFFVLIILLVAFSAWSYQQSRSERRTSSIDETVETAQTTAALVRGLLRDLDSTSLAMALALGAQQQDITQENTADYLLAVQRRNPMLRTIFVMDAAGRVIATSTGQGVGTDLTSRPYTRALLGGQEFILTDVIAGTETGTPTISLARTIRSSGGVLRGMLVIAFYPDKLTELFPGQVPEDTAFTIYDRRGWLVYSSAAPELPYAQRDTSASPDIQAAVRGRLVRVPNVVLSPDQRERLGAFVPVPEYGWAVGSFRTVSAVEAPLERVYRRQLLALGLMATLVSGLAFVFARALTAPLARLADQARSFGRGETRMAAPVRGPAEVRTLASALNQMAAEVDQRFAERDAATAAVRESEDRFRTMADTAPVMIWLATSDTRRTYFNKPWLEFTGRSIEQEVGQGWAEGVHPDDREVCLSTYLDAFVTREPFKLEYRLRRHDGVYHWVMVSAVPRFEPDGGFAGFIGSCVDISDRKEAELQREQLLAREQEARLAAEAANRAKDEFLSVLSHELRTPLTPILGFTELLRRKGGLSEANLARGLETIERSARTQARLVSDLLDVSRIVAGKLDLELSHTDLTPVVEAAVEAVRPAAEARGTVLDVVLSPDTGVVMGDPDRLQQVVWNLLSNAVKFTPGDGRVSVTLERDGDEARITVADSGTGIEPEFLPHVFERFRQADASSTRRHGGLGLGLSIVHRLVEMHGGRVQAESGGAGKGANFTVWLPLDLTVTRLPEPSAAPSHAPANGLAPRLSGLSVLVVEDEDDTREMLRALLERAGATVHAAPSSAAGLTAIGTGSPDIVVADIGMPGEDGYHFIEQLRARETGSGHETPVIALTAYAGTDDRRRALAAGFNRHLTKPIDPGAFIETIAQLAGRSATSSVPQLPA
jgi:PAS domain S-box-containing protein